MTKPVPTWAGVVDQDGRLHLEARRDFDRYLRTLRAQDVEIVVRKTRQRRSVDQNRYWWAVPVRILADYCGYTDAQMHYALLGECFGYTEGLGGKPVPVKPSSSELTVEEFSKLIDWCLDWAASELGVFIPSPDTVAA